jgi:fructosamine-3-kinase
VLGDTVRGVRRLHGGDISQAYCVELVARGRVFVKSRPDAPPNLYPSEALGLAWLRQAGALPVPEVIAVHEHEPRFIALGFVDGARPAARFDEALGSGLAALHAFGAPEFGLAHPNFIGLLEQDNTPHQSWVSFYVERRLRPQLLLACSRGRCPQRWRDRFERLFERASECTGDEPPSRLHGDLWSGNVVVGPGGSPWLIDPAVYGGHREVDLAMMQLFGGFSDRVFEAYDAVFPRQPGAAQRVGFHQLYPLLVHVNCFGGSYVHQVEQRLKTLPG